MRLNKHKRPYIEPTQPKKCRIVNEKGLIFHPTQAPEGLCKCGVMLELSPKTTDYIFPSRIRALHAKEHTIRYASLNNLPRLDNFIIEDVT